jgi:quercetin dioxygenase-like cupin family protein
MQSINLFEKEQFSNKHSHAEPLYVDKNGRVILFTLKPGQNISEHNAPSSPFYVVILSGQGLFTSNDGTALTAGPDTLLIFEPGENHSVQALEEELVFIGFLHGVARAYDS